MKNGFWGYDCFAGNGCEKFIFGTSLLQSPHTVNTDYNDHDAKKMIFKKMRLNLLFAHPIMRHSLKKKEKTAGGIVEKGT